MFNREATPSSVDGFVKLITSFYINAMDNLKVPLKAPDSQAMDNHSTNPRTASLRSVFAGSIENNVSSFK